jgi:hypothetical protein
MQNFHIMLHNIITSQHEKEEKEIWLNVGGAVGGKISCDTRRKSEILVTGTSPTRNII